MDTLSSNMLHYLCDYLPNAQDILSLTLVNKELARKTRPYIYKNIYHKIALNEFENIIVKPLHHSHDITKIKKIKVNTSTLYFNYDFSHTTYLAFDDEFNQPIDNVNLSNLTHLTFGKKFDQKLDGMNLNNVTHLTFGDYFDNPLNGVQLNSLTHLIFGEHYDCFIDHLNLNNLLYLEIGHTFYRFNNNIMLNNLTHFVFRSYGTSNINKFVCPQLKHLEILTCACHMTNDSIDHLNYPNLTYFKFCGNLRSPINNLLQKSPKLEEIILPYDYKQSIFYDCLPKNTKVYIGDKVYINKN